MVVAVAAAVAVAVAVRGWGVEEGGVRGERGGRNDLSSKAFYPATWLDKFANVSGKGKPPGHPVTTPW